MYFATLNRLKLLEKFDKTMSESESEVENQLEDSDEDSVAEMRNDVDEGLPEPSPITNIQDVKFYHILAQLERIRADIMGLSSRSQDLLLDIKRLTDKIG